MFAPYGIGMTLCGGRRGGGGCSASLCQLHFGWIRKSEFLVKTRQVQ